MNYRMTAEEEVKYLKAKLEHIDYIIRDDKIRSIRKLMFIKRITCDYKEV